MKRVLTATAFYVLTLVNANAQSIPTTTITGNLKVNDSLHVIHNISTAGDVKATGEIIAKDTMRAEKDVLVDGNVAIDGYLKVGSDAFFKNSLNLSTNFGIKYTPAVGAVPGIVSFSPFSGRSVLAVQGKVRGCSTFAVGVVNTFADLVQVYNPNGTTLSMGVLLNNNEGIISLEGTTTGSAGTEELSINPKCANSVNMCYGGGFVTVAKNLEIGQKTRNAANALNIVTTMGITKAISVNDGNTEVFSLLQNGSAVFKIGGTNTNALTVFNSSTNVSVFDISNSGKTNIAGEVKIGGQFATTSAYMLTVNGRIGAREIKVSIQNPWPDYVFNETYDLQSLEDVEAYIHTHKHLPNIPAAGKLKEEECGLDLAQMQGMQMEKIEEIYLHLIELSKQMKDLKHENESLKKELSK